MEKDLKEYTLQLIENCLSDGKFRVTNIPYSSSSPDPMCIGYHKSDRYEYNTEISSNQPSFLLSFDSDTLLSSNPNLKTLETSFIETIAIAFEDSCIRVTKTPCKVISDTRYVWLRTPFFYYVRRKCDFFSISYNYKIALPNGRIIFIDEIDYGHILDKFNEKLSISKENEILKAEQESFNFVLSKLAKTNLIEK